MRILLANKFFFLNGGSETVFFQERSFLQKMGFTVVDFSMRDERNLESAFSESFVHAVSYRDGSLKDKLKSASSFIHSSEAVKNIKKLIKTEKPQIAHLHNIYHQLTPSIIPVLKNSGVKTVLTLHDYKLVCPSYVALNNGEICEQCHGKDFFKLLTTNCTNSRLQSLLLMSEAYFHQWRGSYQAVDLFLAPSQFLADLMSQRIPKSKIRVLHNGIDVNEYSPHYDDEGYGLYFGRLSKEKGVSTLLEAYSRLGSNISLKIVGTGPMLDELKQTYSNVDFLGYKSGQELKKIVANAAFVVVPSEWYENCSMVVLEAMALGKSVIGSRIGGIPEQIGHGITGYLFEMGNAVELSDKMKLLSEAKELRQKFGQAAREKLEIEYNLADHCSQLVKIYEGLLK